MCAEWCEELSGRREPGCDYLLRKCSLVSSAVRKQDARLFSEGLLANKVDKSLSPSGAASLWPRFLFLICLFELGLLYYAVEGAAPAGFPLTLSLLPGEAHWVCHFTPACLSFLACKIRVALAGLVLLYPWRAPWGGLHPVL